MAIVAKICLFTCVLTLGQVADRNLWQLTPQLGRGQELVYSGSYSEDSLSLGVEYHRRYRLETRTVVLEANTKGWTVAFLTSLQIHRDRPSPSAGNPAAPISVRLEVVEVDRQGKIAAPAGADLLVPLEGPPTSEMGCLVAAPPVRVGPKHQWVSVEPGRPPLNWCVLGTEVISSTLCVKLEAKQQSPDWSVPRADSTGWQRTEQVWLAPQSGIVYKVKRVIERREPGHEQPTQRSTVQYELDGQWTSPPQLFEDRCREISQAARYSQEAEKYIAQPTRNKAQLEALLQRIDHYLHHRQGESTPQRKCLEQIKHRIEAVRRGEVVASPAATTVLIPVAKVGQRVPDFLVTDLVSKQSVQLYRLLGRPIVIMFYNPKTVTGDRVLSFALQIHRQYKSQVTILGMAVTEDIPFVQKQYRDMGLTFPILDGKGLHKTFGVEATPRLILLDSNGVMRAGFTGWGFHVPEQLLGELQHCLGNKEHP